MWSRGVDHALFRPPTSVARFAPPIFLCVGRVAVEKNLEALLGLDLPGSTVVVGDGPARAALERRFPHAHFLGARYGEALAETYASADVFVFPSRTDTFGIVLIEAMASGLPVAAFPVPGPIDVVGPEAGVLHEDLGAACLEALTIPREAARAYSLDTPGGKARGSSSAMSRRAASSLFERDRGRWNWSATPDPAARERRDVAFGLSPARPRARLRSKRPAGPRRRRQCVTEAGFSRRRPCPDSGALRWRRSG